MPLQRSGELQGILGKFKELAQKEEVGQQNRAEILRAISKLNSIFYGARSEFEPKSAPRSMDEECFERKLTIESVPEAIDQYESYLKAIFLLHKCKELYDLFREYDSPTAALLAKEKAMERNMCRAIGPIQDLVSELFADGVLESITNVLIRLSDTFPRPEECIRAVAYGVARNAEQRRRVKPKDAQKVSGKVVVPPNRFDKNLSVDFIEGIAKCENINESRFSDFSEDDSQRLENDMEEKIDGKELPKEVMSALYSNYPVPVADEMVRFMTVEPPNKESKSCGDVLRRMAEQEPSNEKLLDWVMENLPASSTESSQSWKADSTEELDTGIRNFATRLVTPNFPKFSSGKRYFSNVKDTQTGTVMPIKKYTLGGHAERIRSKTSDVYAREKLLNLEPTPKSLAAKEPLESLLGDKLFDELDPKHKERNEQIKKCMERISFARMERIDRFGDPSLVRAQKKRSVENSVKVKIPEQNGDLIRERMLMREKNSKFELNRKRSYIKSTTTV